MAKQLAFDQIFRQRRAIKRNEGSLAPWSCAVQGARDQFLPGTAFTYDQNRAAGFACGLDALAEQPHRRGSADDPVEIASRIMRQSMWPHDLAGSIPLPLFAVTARW